jgi:hypothetical protein
VIPRPAFRFRDPFVHLLRGPLVYALVRAGQALYVGKGVDIGRPMSRTHHVIPRTLRPRDEIWIWPMIDDATAISFEAALIHTLGPTQNGTRPREKPRGLSELDDGLIRFRTAATALDRVHHEYLEARRALEHALLQHRERRDRPPIPRRDDTLTDAQRARLVAMIERRPLRGYARFQTKAEAAQELLQDDEQRRRWEDHPRWGRPPLRCCIGCRHQIPWQSQILCGCGVTLCHDPQCHVEHEGCGQWGRRRVLHRLLP